jgi:pimeloyl-ACP methyl ester carboxylesterase
MHWRGDPRIDGSVSERDYEVTVAGHVVPGVLWRPIRAAVPVPLVLLGYGSGGHRRDGSRAWQGNWFAQRGVGATSIDLDGHGERSRADGTRPDYGPLVDRVSAEWRAALDACAALADIDATRVAYRGVSMGTMLGLPFIVSEPRVVVAALGLADLRDVPGRFSDIGQRLREAAPLLRCPVLFVMNWDDELVDRASAFELFEALGTVDKELRAYPGPHGAVPAPATESGMQYLLDHLTS